MPGIHPSLSAFANGFKSGKYLGIKSSDDKDHLFDLFDEFGNSRSVYLRESTELFPNLVDLIEKDIDLRSIFLLMITLNHGALAKDFLKCLEENNIFFPIDKPYRSYIRCPNFFAEIAALGDADVTKSLFKYGMSGFKHKLKTDLSEKEKKEKINEFAEELFALTPASGKMPTLEYIICAISPVMLFNEGFGGVDKKDKLAFGEFAYSESYFSGSAELELTYNFPWAAIKVLTELGAQYNIDLTVSESVHLSNGDKLFDLISKAADDKDIMLALLKKLVYPYSKKYQQDIELETFGDNLENYYFSVDVDGMHYDDNPSNVLIKMSPEQIKFRCAAILNGSPKVSQDITEKLEQTIADVRRNSFLRRKNSEDIKSYTVAIQAVQADVEIVKADVEVIKLDLKDLKKACEQLQKIVKDNLADNLIFENIGNNPFLQRLYVGIRNIILNKLKAALEGKDVNLDQQMNLILKNGSVLAGALDFAAGFAGAPGVIGGTFSVIAYACKCFEKLHKEEISEEMKKMLLGSLNLPELIAVGVAEAIILQAKDNVHGREYKESEEKHILKVVDDLVSRQLSNPHLSKLFEIMSNSNHKYRKERDMFEELKRILLQTIADGKPYTSEILEEEKVLSSSNRLKTRIMKTFSSHSKKLNDKKHCVNYHPHDPYGMVHELFKSPSISSSSLSTTPSSDFRLTGSSSGGDGSENKLNF